MKVIEYMEHLVDQSPESRSISKTDPRTAGEVHYRLNERDEIVFVSDAWDAFAAANSGAHLAAARVVGRPLWDFITDPTTELLYRDVLARIRAGRLVRFAFRCDSADCRRRLEMEVSGAPDGGTDFRVRTLSEEVRPPQPLFDPDRTHAEELLRICSWCKKVAVHSHWVEVEEAVSALGLFERPLLPGVTHGICAVCFTEMRTMLGTGEGSVLSDESQDEPALAPAQPIRGSLQCT